jgi:hypothetical protein
MADSLVISLTVVQQDEPMDVARVSEVFARAAAGLALEGISVMLAFGTVKEEDSGSTKD